MPSRKSAKRRNFFCQLPAAAFREISRRAKRHNVAQWEVIVDALKRPALTFKPQTISGFMGSVKFSKK